MPWWIWVFLVGSGIAHGHTVATSVKGVDPTVQHKCSRSLQEYRVRMAKASSNRPCSGTTIAMATRNTMTRLQRDGVEQILDTSWSFDWKLPKNGVQVSEYKFIDPRTQEEVACHSTRIECDMNERLHMVSSLCKLPELPNRLQSGDPYLHVVHPNYVMPYYAGPQLYMQGEVAITIEVRGEINEKWYCPEVRVRWSDDTESRHESDCSPWGTADIPLHRWVLSHRLHCGENRIYVYLYKAGKQFAGETVVINVKC